MYLIHSFNGATINTGDRVDGIDNRTYFVMDWIKPNPLRPSGRVIVRALGEEFDPPRSVRPSVLNLQWSK